MFYLYLLIALTGGEEESDGEVASRSEPDVDQTDMVTGRRFVRRRRQGKRIVHDIESSLDPTNYDPLCAVLEPKTYLVEMTGDRENDIPASTIRWTTDRPPTRRAAPEDIMTKKQQISPAASEAVTPGQLFNLFFTDTMLDLIVDNTNR